MASHAHDLGIECTARDIQVDLAVHLMGVDDLTVTRATHRFI